MTSSEFGFLLQWMSILVLTLTLAVLAWQAIIQNRLLRAQLLKDKFDMYWRTDIPVSDADVQAFRKSPEEYLIGHSPRLAAYLEDDHAIRRFIYYIRVYEYLAYVDALARLRVGDPLSSHTLERWPRALAAIREFRDVHEHYRGYYPHFEQLIDRVVQEAASTTQKEPSSKGQSTPQGSTSG